MIDLTTSNNAIADLSRECSRLERALAAAREAQRVSAASSSWMRRACHNIYNMLKDGQVTQAIAEAKAIPDDTTAGVALLAELERLKGALAIMTTERDILADNGDDLSSALRVALGNSFTPKHLFFVGEHPNRWEIYETDGGGLCAIHVDDKGKRIHKAANLAAPGEAGGW